MIRFLADEDFNRAIVRGVLRARPDLDVVRVQDEGLRTQDDTVVLEWAAQTGRVLLTHDAKTMPTCAYERVSNALPMPGIFVVQQEAPIGRVIEEIILLAEYSLGNEWDKQVSYLPLK